MAGSLRPGWGLVPRQHSSGGKARLFGISKRGDAYLRTLFIHGCAVRGISSVPEDGSAQRLDRRQATKAGNHQGLCSSCD